MEDREKRIQDFVARYPTLNDLVNVLLTSDEADFLFEKIEVEEEGECMVDDKESVSK